jgi:Cellulose binding domain
MIRHVLACRLGGRHWLMAPVVLAAAVTAAWVPPAGAPASAAAGCSVGYQVDQWSTGFTAAVTITNGSTAVSAWTLTWTFPGNQRITSAWNVQLTQPPGQAAVTAGNLAYNGALGAGGSVQFGFQADWSGANTAPADFTLNGAACSGPGGPVTTPPTTTPPPPPTTTPAPVGCAGASVCDDVEGQQGPAPSGPWAVSNASCSGTGAVAVDSAVAHSGSRSFRVDGKAGFCNHAFVGRTDIASIGSVLFGRFYVRHSTLLPDGHVTMMAMRDSNDGNRDLRMGGQNRAMQWNRESDDATLPVQSPAGVAQSIPLPTGSWVCIEFTVDGPGGQLRTWVNGTDVPGLRDDGQPTQDVDAQWLGRPWHPSLIDFRLGWESYSTGDDTLWFDDIALGRTRIGC